MLDHVAGWEGKSGFGVRVLGYSSFLAGLRRALILPLGRWTEVDGRVRGCRQDVGWCVMNVPEFWDDGNGNHFYSL
jgi:hypothetical protein